MTERLELLKILNPRFADDLDRRVPWAVKHADAVLGLDGKASRRHPERAFKEKGLERRNWCGACADQDGCVSCDLDEPIGQAYTDVKYVIGKLRRPPKSRR